MVILVDAQQKIIRAIRIVKPYHAQALVDGWLCIKYLDGREESLSTFADVSRGDMILYGNATANNSSPQQEYSITGRDLDVVPKQCVYPTGEKKCYECEYSVTTPATYECSFDIVKYIEAIRPRHAPETKTCDCQVIEKSCVYCGFSSMCPEQTPSGNGRDFCSRPASIPAPEQVAAIRNATPENIIEQLSDLNRYSCQEYDEANLSDNEREMGIHLEYGNRLWGILQSLRTKEQP